MLSSEAELEAIIREQIEKALAAQLTELMTRKREKAVLLKEEKIKSKRPLRLRRPWKECGVRKLWKKKTKYTTASPCFIIVWIVSVSPFFSSLNYLP